VRSLRRWLKSTSNRTFVVWPVVLLAAEALLQQGMPVIHWWALPLLAWGYLQYRLVGNLRAREGGGGPGIAIPPDRIVRQGPYRFVRNPMYLAVAATILGQALLLGRWLLIGYAALFLAVVATFVRVYEEPTLRRRYGAEYDAYCARVPGWLPRLRRNA